MKVAADRSLRREANAAQRGRRRIAAIGIELSKSLGAERRETGAIRLRDMKVIVCPYFEHEHGRCGAICPGRFFGPRLAILS